MEAHLALKCGCEFYPYQGYPGKEEFIIRTPDDRQFRIPSLAKKILEQLDGSTALTEVSQRLSIQMIPLTTEELRHLLDTHYAPLGIFESSPVSSAPPCTSTLRPPLRLPLLLSWELIPQRVVAEISARLQRLFRWGVASPLLLLAGVLHWPVYFGGANLRTSHGNSLVVLGLCLLSILVHEFGHAAAVSRFGGSPGKIGVGLYLLFPTFYADVSQVWRFPRQNRLAVDLGGIYFQQIVFSVFAALWLLYSSPEFLVACRAIDLMTLMALNPMFQFDGYWFLADWLGIPNLHRVAIEFVKSKVRMLLGRGTAQPQVLPRSRGKHAAFIVYAVVCNLLLGVAVWWSFGYVHLTFVGLFKTVPALCRATAFAWNAHDPATAFDRLTVLGVLLASSGSVVLGLSTYVLYIARYIAARLRDWETRTTKASANAAGPETRMI